MKIPDLISKLRTHEKDPQIKNYITERYKYYRNLIKENHYNYFSLQNQGNVKKTWDGIRELINVSKINSHRLQK